uniref:Ovule protein n=1 Tax=Heterorhabditis bacteriophora TaxID=37862 RepID=A0A1I7W9W6_HETBA
MFVFCQVWFTFMTDVYIWHNLTTKQLFFFHSRSSFGPVHFFAWIETLPTDSSTFYTISPFLWSMIDILYIYIITNGQCIYIALLLSNVFECVTHY